MDIAGLVIASLELLQTAHLAQFALYDVCDMSVPISRRPLTASVVDQALFVEPPELGELRAAIDLGFNAFVAGPPGSGKTTLLRHLESRYDDRGVVFVRAEPEPTPSDLIRAIADAIALTRADSGQPATQLDGTELDLGLIEAALGDDDDRTTKKLLLLVDGVSTDQLMVIFGRYRDPLWELPITWVVSSRSRNLEPPADAFFDRVVELGPWSADSIRELIERRAPDLMANPQTEGLVGLLAPAYPLEMLLAVQVVAVSSNTEDMLEVIGAERDRVNALPDSLRYLYDALTAVGPSSASDERLLEQAGISRTRATHGLKELEDLDLVTAERDGRRVLYQNLRNALVHSTISWSELLERLGERR